MNFVVSSSALLKHLQSISGVLSTSNALPILDNFLVEVGDGRLTISASDLETTMRTSMEAETKEQGKIAIPAKLLLDVLKALPDQPCAFLVNPTNFSIEISYDNGKSKMTGFNGDDYPKTPSIENSNQLKVSGEIISKAINKTLFATGNDELRPVMSGVYCQFSPEELIHKLQVAPLLFYLKSL
jgi:DNA polymerase-3 subunit beta